MTAPASEDTGGSPLALERVATEFTHMPRIDPRAVQKMMARRNFLFKHQMANALAISYERLTQILVGGEDDVEEALIVRICKLLDCDRQQIMKSDQD